MPIPRKSATVGILYPGELGAVLGRLLAERGVNVLTTVEGRSPRTRQRSIEAGLNILPSLEDVVAQADVLLATVSPAAAISVAESYRECRHARAGQVYVDLCSIGPETVQQIAAILAPTGAAFVDGALHGLATLLPGRGTFYLSGPAAPVVELFAGFVRVRVLGDEPGQASTFKMLVSGLAKGTVALFLEMSVAARQAGLLEELLTCYRDAYPGIMTLVERLLPTFPRHAARRVDELREMEQMLTALHVEPGLVRGTRQLTAALAHADLGSARTATEAPWSVEEIIESFAQATSVDPPVTAAPCSFSHS